MDFPVGTKVKWSWYGRSIHGKVEEVMTETVSKTIKGKKIARHGTLKDPACLVKSDAGNLALKLASELEEDTKVSSKSSPRMFQD